jgi:hypothetical protein
MLKGQIDGRNNSWAIRWYASAFLANKLTLYPGQSLVNNIGFDGSGTHSDNKSDKTFATPLSNKDIILKFLTTEESQIGRKAFIKFFRSLKLSILRRAFNKIIRTIK